MRIYGVELIQRAAKLLRLPVICSVSAAAIFQRFYFRKSFAAFDVRTVAPAALLLASKLEEHHRRLRDVIIVFHRLEMRAVVMDCGVPMYVGGPVPSLDSAGRDAMKQEIMRVERLILHELGWVVYLLLEHPHKYVIQFVKSVVRSPQSRVVAIAEKAWGYLNDSTRTVLCCMHAPHKITTASIYLATCDMNIKLPSNPPWWTLFDTELHELESISKMMLSLYKQPPARYISVPAKMDPLLFGLGTPFPDTPFPNTPLKSPMSDDDVQASPPAGGDASAETTNAADADRINEMIKESETTRQRSRSPKRKVIQLQVQKRR